MADNPDNIGISELVRRVADDALKGGEMARRKLAHLLPPVNAARARAGLDAFDPAKPRQ